MANGTERSFSCIRCDKAEKRKLIYLVLAVLPLVCLFFSLLLGRFPVPITVVIQTIAAKLFQVQTELPPMYETIVWELRLPRTILGLLVGGALAVSGASFQGLFRNPLVSAGILGVSSGAGFGAALAILLFNSTTYVYILAFTFGVLAVLASCLIGRIYDTTPTVMLVLGGVIVSSVFGALISLVKYAADPYNQLPAIVFWLMGSLASARYEDIQSAGVLIVVGVTGLVAIRWRINVLSMGDKEAHCLGINTAVAKGAVIACATMATAGAVCVSGIIGWVGLIIPHIARMLVGSDNRRVIPASFCLGASFLICVDMLGRTLFTAEIPLGILTSLAGGPFFVYLLKNTKGKSW